MHIYIYIYISELVTYFEGIGGLLFPAKPNLKMPEDFPKGQNPVILMNGRSKYYLPEKVCSNR